MTATPTLHDFVLNLLVDPAARSAFELDPEAALRNAGLSDVTAADVQEVIPLVVDYAPIDGITNVDLDDPLFDVDTAAGAVGPLQGITQQPLGGGPLSSGHGTSLDIGVNATAAAGLSVNLGQLPIASVPWAGIGGGPGGVAAAPADLSAVTDPARTLDATEPVVGGVTGSVAGITEPVDGVVDPAHGLIDPVLGGLQPALGGVVDPALGGVSGATGAIVEPVTGLDPVTGTLDSLGLGGLGGTGVDAGADAHAGAHAGATSPGLLDPVTGVTGSVLPGNGLLGGVGGGSGHANPPSDPDHGGLTDLLP